ncbi:hypothetical protein POPTR_006G278900v4 [Populus trichocarpa]|uniref:Uncharacterized protein n=1 Tax=Populus trichocarpa TaxID=3694 RepID=A0ACC0SWY9_POPTR|nr:AIG2-like protein D isoform X5 [Populus trichocarpa]KAI9393743.1 hypothetical protein POPTR_006G278900v4 [Populus trichocarpa]|eukprot:XP_024460316.1 AIG2-like protein D isoform X5 [Populus trichocarpa]
MAMAAAAGGNQVHNVFVYGSLLADDVVRALLSRIPQSSPAILNGYHRFSIKGRVYPAILPVENKKVSGKVLHGITDPELYILDEYEDVEYERVTVDVSLMEWKRTQMEDFAKMSAEFRQDLEQPESKTRIATYESFYQQDGGRPLMP